MQDVIKNLQTLLQKSLIIEKPINPSFVYDDVTLVVTLPATCSNWEPLIADKRPQREYTPEIQIQL